MKRTGIGAERFNGTFGGSNDSEQVYKSKQEIGPKPTARIGHDTEKHGRGLQQRHGTNDQNLIVGHRFAARRSPAGLNLALQHFPFGFADELGFALVIHAHGGDAAESGDVAGGC